MPVMVFGVDNVVGAQAARSLVARGGEVRAFVPIDGDGDDGRSGDVARLHRDLGCKVAHGSLDDEAHVESALEQVHTALVLTGRPTDDADAHLEQVATIVSAAIGARCRRLVLLSDLAVTDPGDNAWLLALQEAEEMVEAAPMEGVVLRCATIYGSEDPLTDALAAGALGEDPPGSGWPVHAGDVAVAAVVADADRRLDSALHVVVDVTGPERVSTADLARALARGSGAAPAPGSAATLPAHAVDLLTRVVDRPDGAVGLGGTLLASVAPR